MKYLRRFIIVLITTAAVFQWAIVLERATSAIWTWYKFVGYGGGGHIVVAQTTQIVFLLGAGIVATVGYMLSKSESRRTGSRLWPRLARLSWSSVTVCTLLWIALLLSPLVRFN